MTEYLINEVLHVPEADQGILSMQNFDEAHALGKKNTTCDGPHSWDDYPPTPPDED